MHKLPYENLVKILIINKESPVAIIDTLKSMDFTLPLNITDLCKKIHKDLVAENPEYFAGTISLEDNWLKTIGLYELYYGHYGLTPDNKEDLNGFLGAKRIIEDPRMRRAIQAMALIKITQEDIELVLNAKYDFNFVPEEIEFFLNNYFNVNKWTLPQIKALVDIEPNKEFKEMYLLALKGDKSYLMWKLGLSPNKSYQEMLQDMMNDAYYLFKENSRPGQDNEAAIKWSNIAIKVAEKLDKSGKDEDEALTLFQSITFNTQMPEIGTKILPVEELPEGELPGFENRSEQTGFPRVNLKKLQNGVLPDDTRNT